IAGEPVEVWADILRHGHAVLAAALLWRPGGGRGWGRAPLRRPEKDRWTASFTPLESGGYLYAIEAWMDPFATWRRDFLRKREAGLDVELEIREGRELLARLKPRSVLHARAFGEACRNSDNILAVDKLLSEKVAAAATSGLQIDLTRSA